ncbi:MAG TPA: HNH endonuclease [Pirellulales bacterium]|nr:HNH endonuclease [Pirellulales bacterium]
MAIDAALRRLVRQRARNRCEYCGIQQEELPFVTFHIEHVVSRQHGGGDDADNLCEACHWCNFAKGTNLATIVDGLLVRLFHPRRDVWSEPFMRRGDLVIGLTPVGRGTVRLLDMNDDDRRQIRSSSSHDEQYD